MLSHRLSSHNLVMFPPGVSPVAGAIGGYSDAWEPDRCNLLSKAMEGGVSLLMSLRSASGGNVVGMLRLAGCCVVAISEVRFAVWFAGGGLCI